MATRSNVKRPRGLWPEPYEVDSAINKRAQAMARMRRSFSRADSNKAANSLIRALYGRNAQLESGQRDRIRDMLWNDYQSYPSGYKGFHRTAAGRKRKKNPSSRNAWKAGKWIKASAVRVRKVAGRVVMDIKKAI